ncbi:MAG: hypothetical protein DHS20C17_14660 [Cyclobacteriaceae bacterium]|nr:MAG: hypothetical protein DHS20C17_14660 [Cyclobacteriaceae bacterium]
MLILCLTACNQRPSDTIADKPNFIFIMADDLGYGDIGVYGHGPMKNMSTTEFFNSSGPLRGAKRDLYEGGIREPFIVKWPGKIAAGSTSDYLGGFWDMLPTLLDFAGHPVPQSIDGISMRPVMTGQPGQKYHPYLYWEFHEGTGAQAIRQGQWKGVKLEVKQEPNAPMELYNLTADIAETHNVADKYPDKVIELEALMNNARTPSKEFPLAVDN